jgi:hypothetical protein
MAALRNAAGDDQLQLRQAAQQRLVEPAALAHHAQHLIRREPRRHGRGVGGVVVKKGDLANGVEGGPVDHRAGDILPIVDDCDAESAHRKPR